MPSLAIIRVFNTSKGFPASEPIPPAIAPDMNFIKKLASLLSAPRTSLTGSYNPKRREVQEASRSQAALIPL